MAPTKYYESSLTSYVLSYLLGQHSTEGAEHKTTGGFHVQRAEEAGLRRRLPLALPVHRLKQPSPPTQTTTTPPPSSSSSSRGATPNRSRRPRSPPSYSAPCLVNQVCLHLQRSQFNLIPIDFYWSNVWFCTRRSHTCTRMHTFVSTSLFVFLRE